jgi:quercetin dioxygenase-like cupin family protein
MARDNRLGRRGFVCAICAAVGTTASGTRLMAAGWGGTDASTYTRTTLDKTEYPGATHLTLQVQVDITSGAVIPRHTHPGVESAFVTMGGGELVVDGHPPRQVRAGDSYQIPPGAVHGLRNGDAPTRVLVTYVVEKDKPLTTLVPE